MTIDEDYYCAAIRLRKPIEYYHEKYASCFLGFSLLMGLIRDNGMQGVRNNLQKLVPSPRPFETRIAFSSVRLNPSVGQSSFDTRYTLGHDAVDQIVQDFYREVRRLERDMRYQRDEFGAEDDPLQWYPSLGFYAEVHAACVSSVDSPDRHLSRTSSCRHCSAEFYGYPCFKDIDRILREVIQPHGMHPDLRSEWGIVDSIWEWASESERTELYHRLRDAGLPGEDIATHILELFNSWDVFQNVVRFLSPPYCMVAVAANGDVLATADGSDSKQIVLGISDEFLLVTTSTVGLSKLGERFGFSFFTINGGSVLSIRRNGTIHVGSTQIDENKPSDMSPVNPDEIRKANRHYSVFISFGGPDIEFAARIDETLRGHGVRTFLFTRDAVPGQKLHRMMRQNINAFDRVLVICSRNSLSRSGVINEIEETLQRESRSGGAEILIPVTIDNFVFEGWKPERPDLALAIRDRVIGDFRDSLNRASEFHQMISRLLASLTKQ